MTETQNIQIACMSLMWGYDLPNERLDGWLADVSAAGYQGAATFENELLRWHKGMSLAERLADRGLGLASIDWIINPHLHIDHCGGNAHFPTATVVIQANE